MCNVIENYTEENSKIIDRWIDEGIEWGKPLSHEEYVMAQQGNWEVWLAFDSVPHEWFLPYINLETKRFDGAKLLGLANGAECTILDYSDRQLATEKSVAERV